MPKDRPDVSVGLVIYEPDGVQKKPNNDDIDEIIPNRIVGKRLTVVQCKGAMDTLEAAFNEKNIGAKKRLSLKNSLKMQMERLSRGERLSRENFPKEGKLPALPGKSKKDFYAFKRIPIRAYCWYSEVQPGLLFVSHYCYKDYDRLAQSDELVICDNWKRIEEQDDER